MQGTLTRKQREIQGREGRILEVARSMIVQDGYHGLSMDRIAEALEYSKGNDLPAFLVQGRHPDGAGQPGDGMSPGSVSPRGRVFAAARGNASRPIGAACELFFQLYPDHFHIEHVIRISINQGKDFRAAAAVSGDRAKRDARRSFAGVIRDAVAAGDLELSDDYGVDHVAFGLWSITFGGYSIAATSPSLANLGIHDPLLAIRENCNRLLDGVGWKPLSSELDLSSFVERIKREVFAAEFAKLSER